MIVRMKKQIHRAKDRGQAEHGWLHTHYSFSFADWYEPSRMGFGSLRVLNDDLIDPSSGFDAHAHRDMEIITIVLKGTLTHRDNMGNVGTIPAGDVQVMSAGTGVMHSEHNDSATERLELFQIWIETKDRGIEPRYEQKSFGNTSIKNVIQPLVVSDMTLEPTEALTIHQDASISRVLLEPDHSIEYKLASESHGVYVFVIEGQIEVDGVQFDRRDAVGVFETQRLFISTKTNAEILLIEVPMS